MADDDDDVAVTAMRALLRAAGLDPDDHRGRYILNDAGEPEPCVDLLRWAVFYEQGDRQVCQDIDVEGDAPVRVSTVFLSLDANWPFRRGAPLLWETRVFGGPLDTLTRRYTSRLDALAGHAEVWQQVRAARP